MRRARYRNGGDGPTLAEHFDGLRSDYNAARTGRFRRRRSGIAASGASADYHYRSDADYLRILEYARDMDRNDAVVGQIVDRAVINTVQDGIKLDPQTGDAKLDADLWARWDAFTGDPDQADISGEMDFAAQEFMALRHCHVDGDMVILGTEDGPLQLNEGHRCRSPLSTKRNVVQGVLLDERRRRLEYWLTKDDINPLDQLRLVSQIERYPVRDEDGVRQIFHPYNPKRVSQTRGVSSFAPIFDLCGMFEDINFAKLVQQQIVSCFAIFRQRELGFRAAGDESTGEETTESLADGSTRTVQGIAPGMEISGAPGERLEGFSPNVPNAEFFEHVKLILTLIGINLGLPLVLTLMDASETNFSGFRGAVDQARMGFRWNQKWFIHRLHRPAYLWKLHQWMGEDAALRGAAARANVNLFGHRWNRPTWPYIEPWKDAQSDLLKVRGGLTSPRRLHAENGNDWEEIAAESVQDNAYAIRKAKAEAQKINAEFKDDAPVHWRELISLPLPEGVTVAVGKAEPAESKAKTKESKDE